MLSGTPLCPDEPPLDFQGTTHTGLDRLVEIIVKDPGLNRWLCNADILAAAQAADQMNAAIVAAIAAAGVATDGTLNAADVRELNHYLRETYGEATWSAWHGDDEEGSETGFHLVQNDGASTQIFGYENAVNTVADGIYHLGYEICGDQLLNEDGNPNASVSSVAFWLSDFLREDLKTWAALDDAFVAPHTGTGLDTLVDTIVSDPGLNKKVRTGEIYEAAQAAYEMNQLILAAIVATGAANDDSFNTADVRELNHYLREAYGETAWSAWHGDDEEGSETGFHLVQNDGATSTLFNRNAVNTVADGVYHLGYAISGDQLLNEDGNKNAGLSSVAFWLNGLLAEDLAGGGLQNAALMPSPAAIGAAAAYAYSPPGPFAGDSFVDLPHTAATAQADGTIAVRFTAANVVGRHTLFSKDAAGYGAGGHITALVRDGRVEVRMQNTRETVCLASQGGTVLAGKEYDLAVSFGADGLRLYLDGEPVAARATFTTGLAANAEKLVLGASAASRSVKNANWAVDFFVGAIDGITIYNRALTQPEIALVARTGRDPVPSHGTTGTGLDKIVDLIVNDPGLNRSTPVSEILAGAGYANQMNAAILAAIAAAGVATDGTLNAADVRELNHYLRETYGEATWSA
jgi:hypothetical protein